VTRKKNDTHRGTGRKLFPLRKDGEGPSQFKKIQKIIKDVEDEEAKQQIKDYKHD
jgi:hypothetical protein